MRSVVFVPRGVAALAMLSAALLSSSAVGPARAQDSAEVLPPIDVISTRIGTRTNSGSRGRTAAPASAPTTTSAPADLAPTGPGDAAGGGITGASTTIITSADLERAPQATLQDILSREAGIQTTTLYGGVNGTGTSVDMRGFGTTAPSNTLVLVDGRRFNDSDLTGFDFSLIPRDSIDRIEITRGSSGTVLYGDGAVGGVINIVTKNGVGAAPNARVEGGFGSFHTGEANVSVSGSYNGLAAAGFGKAFRSDGYRTHNETRQNQGMIDLRYAIDQGSVFFNIMADDLRQNLPGPRNISSGGVFGFYNEYLTDRRGTNTPLDNVNRQNLALRGGVTRNLWSGAVLTVDGSFRRKQTQFASFNPYNNPFATPNLPSSYNTFDLTTASVTPRLNVDQTFGFARLRMIGGFDVYRTSYQSDRALFNGAPPNHIYNLDQTTAAGYVQPTVTLWDKTDISLGGRVQQNSLRARDVYDPTAPAGIPVAPGTPLDATETRHATHIGAEHRFNKVFAVFARMAQSFRVPNIDERIGSGAGLGAATAFNLRTQRSHDYEAGFRVHAGPFDMQTSAYRMYLVDELHLNPVTFSNTNFDPTLRSGVETSLSYKVTEAFRLKGTVSNTRARFRSGPFAGNDVPLVSRWTESAGFSWDVYQKYLTVDATARFASKRYLEADEANVGRMLIPSSAVFDLRVGGEVKNFFWAVNVQNLFNRMYFDYGVDNSFPGNLYIAIYPQPGRTIQFKLGARFG